MSNINTIIFDLGGVLIDWDPRHLYRKLFADASEMEYFLAHICTPDWNEQQDAGYPTARATAEKIAEFPEYTEAIQAFYGCWAEMLNGPIESTVRLLDQLARQHTFRLLALTNWSHETWPVALDRYDFLSYFEGILVSGQEKLRKPDPAFYRLLFRRYEVDPARAFFIDDNLRNVEAGRRLGLKSHHFHSSSLLAEDLQQLGIL